jgi:hypothetical protein
MIGDAAEQGAVLGVDIGWSTTRRSSAACLLAWCAIGIRLELARFTALVHERRHALAKLVDGRSGLTVAIDGPLRGDLRVIGRYRNAERWLTRGFARRIGKPGQSSSPNGRKLNRHASAVARRLLAWGCVGEADGPLGIGGNALVEAFPTSFLGVLLEPGRFPRPPGRSVRSDLYYVALADDASNGLVALLADLLPGRRLGASLGSVTDHDERAAVVCALTALCVARGRYTAVGDPDGHIVLPPAATGDRPGMRPWALALLRQNGAPC